MCASKNDSVYLGIVTKQVANALLNKIVGTGRVELVVLDQRHPHRTRLACNLYVWVQLGYFKSVGVALDGTRCGNNAYMARQCYVAYAFCSGTYDAQHTTLRVDARQIVLLNAAQRLCRGCVATKNDELATHVEQFAYCLQRELVDDLETACSIGSTRIVAQVQIVVLGKHRLYLTQNGQTSVAGVENAYGRHHREMVALT